MKHTTRNKIFNAIKLGPVLAGLTLGGMSLHADEAAASTMPQMHQNTVGACHASGGTPSYTNQGYIRNNSTSSTMSLRCSMPRRGGYTTTGLRAVYINDKSTSAGIKCSVYEANAYGTSWSWSNWKTSVGGGNSNYGVLSWSSVSVKSQSGYSTVYCQVPPKDSTYGQSWVAQYRIGG
jgi:hypothetical protein